MIYDFDTTSVEAASAALLVYAIYRSRDRKRYKVTPDVWGQIERFTKASAKRAPTLTRFVEALKPRLCCDTIHPRWMAVGIRGLTAMINREGQTEYLERSDSREFLTSILGKADDRKTLLVLLKETAWVILLVRDRLEREKPIESQIGIEDV